MYVPTDTLIYSRTHTHTHTHTRTQINYCHNNDAVPALNEINWKLLHYIELYRTPSYFSGAARGPEKRKKRQKEKKTKGNNKNKEINDFYATDAM